MPWTEIIVGVVLVILFFGLFRRSSSRSPRIWSGDAPEEQERRNTRTDINYQGWGHWQSNRRTRAGKPALGATVTSTAWRIIVSALFCWSGMAVAANVRRDPTADALDRCLTLPANTPTAGQTDCEALAARSYDRRMNTAYAALLHRLPPKIGEQLRRSQRAWLAFRDSEAAARQAIYATRQGTMYVPMESDDAVTIIGDRARLLERYLRVLAIEP